MLTVFLYESVIRSWSEMIRPVWSLNVPWLILQKVDTALLGDISENNWHGNLIRISIWIALFCCIQIVLYFWDYFGKHQYYLQAKVIHWTALTECTTCVKHGSFICKPHFFFNYNYHIIAWSVDYLARVWWIILVIKWTFMIGRQAS